MAPKIFMTGVTGYVGGTVFNTLVTAQPEYTITVLLRNPKTSFSEKYRNVKVLTGDFENFELLKDAASKADIVVRMSLHSSAGGGGGHSQATGAMLVNHNSPKDHGDSVKTGVVCPPIIHGRGTGPGRVDSIFYPSLLSACVETGAAFYHGAGSNVYSRVHVEDVAQVFVRLNESAAAGGESAGWGREGYYFTTSEEITRKEISVAAGKILKQKGLVATEEPKQVTLQELDSLLSNIPFPGVARLLFAANSRSNPDRARKVLAYEPRGRSFLNSLEDDLERAAR